MKIIYPSLLFFLSLSLFVPRSNAQLMQAKEQFTRADSLRGSLTPERMAYVILYYNLDMKVDIDNRFISGSNLLKFKANSDFERLQFDLFENLKVEKVVYKKKELKFQREYAAVFVDFPELVE